MIGPNFAALTRRASLVTLGGAGMGMMGNPSIGAAKKKKKRKKGQDTSGCKRQAQVWQTFIGLQCEVNPEPACEDALACSEPLETCNFTEFFSCFQAATAP